MSETRARKIFVTGATGFIGRAVLDRFGEAGFDFICLARRPDRLSSWARARAVAGDLAEPAAYADALAEADTVLHMAAATGAASAEELRTTNVDGTRTLLEACKARGVRRIVYVSSIAARYADLSDYPYGQTKQQAEAVVSESGLEHAILRPTIVMGEGGSGWTMLRKLACLPVVPLLAGGRTQVQPIDVADVARGIALTLEDFRGGAFDLGGPEVLSFGELLRRIRKACGRGDGVLLPLPVWPLRTLLNVANAVLPGKVPGSAGQLVPFLQDGTAEPSHLHERLEPGMTPLDALLQRLAHVA